MIRMSCTSRFDGTVCLRRLQVLTLVAAMFVGGAADAAQVVVNGPADSGEFGARVAVLANGNFVVTDPGFDAPGPIADVGAVYLYRADGVLIEPV